MKTHKIYIFFLTAVLATQVHSAFAYTLVDSGSTSTTSYIHKIDTSRFADGSATFTNVKTQVTLTPDNFHDLWTAYYEADSRFVGRFGFQVTGSNTPLSVFQGRDFLTNPLSSFEYNIWENSLSAADYHWSGMLIPFSFSMSASASATTHSGARAIVSAWSDLGANSSVASAQAHSGSQPILNQMDADIQLKHILLGKSGYILDTHARANYFNGQVQDEEAEAMARMLSIEFNGFTHSSDFTIVSASPVPVPAAVWLMGTGLLGLIALSRKNKTQAFTA